MSQIKRILIICQLLCALTFFCWLLLRPALEERIVKSTKIELLNKIIAHPHFTTLSLHTQTHLLTQKEEPFYPTNYFTSLRSQIKETPKLYLLWMLLAMITPFLPNPTLFLLPLLLGLHTLLLLTKPPLTVESWHHYLIKEWAKEEPSSEPTLVSQQVEVGLFYFNVARASGIIKEKVFFMNFYTPSEMRRSLLYFIGNLFVAIVVNRRKKIWPFLQAQSMQN